MPIVMGMSLYLSDGKDVVGPLNAYEALKYAKGQKLSLENWQVCDSSHLWKPLSGELPNLALQALDPGTTRPKTESPAGGDQTKPRKKYESLVDPIDEPAALERLAKIRLMLDSVWEKQRERIIAVVKNRDAADSLKVAGKDLQVVQEQINNLTLEYWRKAGTLLEWVRDLTWGDPDEVGDYYMKLTSTETDKKMEEVRTKLEENELNEQVGCYCFMNGRNYEYIGETTEQTLAVRILTGHKNKDWWDRTDAMRIIIPKNSKNTKRLERLLILAYDPKSNTAEGRKTSAADEVLETISDELNELTKT